MLRNKINQNEPILGSMLSEIYTPNIVRVMKEGGIEFIIVDNEHGYFDDSQLANITAVCNGIQLPVVVRVPTISKEKISKVLDMGADGILAPMVNNHVEAKNIVNYAKYKPLGNRGLSLTRAHSNYNPGELTNYINNANKKTIIFVQVETKEGIENSNKIANVEGIDAVIVGPNDLALDLDIPGDFDNKLFIDAVDKVIDSCKSVDKPCGMISSKMKLLHEMKNKGMSIFSCDSELGMILKSVSNIKNNFYYNKNEGY